MKLQYGEWYIIDSEDIYNGRTLLNHIKPYNKYGWDDLILSIELDSNDYNEDFDYGYQFEINPGGNNYSKEQILGKIKDLTKDDRKFVISMLLKYGITEDFK